MNTDDTKNHAADPAAGSEEVLTEPVRKPKRLVLFNTPETWLPLGLSERLLRQRPGEPVLYECTSPDAAATARNIISFAQRIKGFVKDFRLTTTQCIVISTTFRKVVENGVEKGYPEDVARRYIQVIVEQNSLYDEWLLRERSIDAQMQEEIKRIEQEGPKPKGRPRKPKPEPAADAPPKRGRGRPRKNQTGQDSLI